MPLSGEITASYHDFVGSYFSNRIYRPAGNTAARIYLRPGNERPCCSLPIHHAFGVRSIFLLCKIHRRVLSPVCSADIGGRAPRLEGKLPSLGSDDVPNAFHSSSIAV